MTERYHHHEAPEDELALLSVTDVLELEDADQLRDTRRFLLLSAQANINLAYEITDLLVADGEEPKSRRKRVAGLGDV